MALLWSGMILAALLLEGASAAKILAMMTVVSHSHHLWNAKYLEALTQKGHQVTYLNVDKFINTPPENITQILIEGAYDLFKDAVFAKFNDVGSYQSMLYLHQANEVEAEIILRSEGLKELKRVMEREKFDLVVHDFACCWFLLGAVDVLGRPPVVGITAFGTPTLALTVLANPMAHATKPHFLSQYSDTMSFFQRADNYCLHLWTVALDWFYLRKQSGHSKAVFGPDVRPLDQILRDINIIMVNSNNAVDFPFPRVPGLIPVGGLHIKKPKPLPQDLKTFLDEAENGVIYFSLGSNILSSELSKEKVDVLVEAFRQISPVRVLWKWESDSFANKPANVKTGKWLPQTDILAHPNVRLFFTHSGLLSTQEALYHGKPMVGMPFFLDQHVNVNKCVQRGFGEKLYVESLTVDGVVAALEKVLNDPVYTENARKASFVFRDESDHPLDRAVYWTEYAIRHKGAPHLQHAAKNLSWYQTWMLDVLVLASSAVFLVSFSIYKLIVAIFGSPKKQPKAKRH